jgi:predicted nucleic acid-binding protein
MINAVFADTSFYAAILNRHDQFHARAKEVGYQRRKRTITTEFVLLETANFCLEGNQRNAYLRLVARLRAAQSVEIIAASSELFQRGLDLFAARPDKHWSLTDCISFAVMNEHGLTDALTAHHNFEQVGFQALLR